MYKYVQRYKNIDTQHFEIGWSALISISGDVRTDDTRRRNRLLGSSLLQQLLPMRADQILSTQLETAKCTDGDTIGGTLLYFSASL